MDNYTFMSYEHHKLLEAWQETVEPVTEATCK